MSAGFFSFDTARLGSRLLKDQLDYSRLDEVQSASIHAAVEYVSGNCMPLRPSD